MSDICTLAFFYFGALAVGRNGSIATASIVSAIVHHAKTVFPIAA